MTDKFNISDKRGLYMTIGLVSMLLQNLGILTRSYTSQSFSNLEGCAILEMTISTIGFLEINLGATSSLQCVRRHWYFM